MKWNLVDLLSENGSEDPLSGKRREFYLPLASIAPGMEDTNNTRNVNKELYHLDDAAEQIPSDNHALIITIKPVPGFSFSDDGDFPDPSIRIHAIGGGMIRFKPTTEDIRDSLVLTMLGFQFPDKILPKVKWWERWIETNCIIKDVIYENINKSNLEGVLNSIEAPNTALISDRVEPTFGLNFPSGVTQNNKNGFITNFLQGNEENFIVVEPGAYIGKVNAMNLSEADTPNSNKRLTLKVIYSDHTQTSPHYMNPRELFYLLFGKDSYEATHHPLLIRFNEKGDTQDNISIEAKRMYLRPPLRTHARVKWEARKEIDNHAESWGVINSSGEYITIGPERFYNTQPPFFKDRYPPPEKEPNTKNTNKCNLFVFEICLRSGFKVRVWLDSSINLLFYKAPDPRYKDKVPDMSLARDIRTNNTYKTKGFAPLTNSEGIIWGRRWTKRLIEIVTPDERCDELNKMMEEEGRCFILVKAISGERSGHIAIMHHAEKHNNLTPKWLDESNLGLQVIRASVYENSDEKALDRVRDVYPNEPHVEGNELFLVELCPGKDPDTVMGLSDLCVR